MRLERSYNSLHCAGNGAHFTLRALLLSAVQGFIQRHHQPISNEHDHEMDTLRQVTAHPIPYRTNSEIEAMTGKAVGKYSKESVEVEGQRRVNIYSCSSGICETVMGMDLYNS